MSSEVNSPKISWEKPQGHVEIWFFQLTCGVLINPGPTRPIKTAINQDNDERENWGWKSTGQEKAIKPLIALIEKVRTHTKCLRIEYKYLS